MPKVPAAQTPQWLRPPRVAIETEDGVRGKAEAIPEPLGDERFVGNPPKSQGPPELEPLVVSPKVAKYLLGIGTTKLWELIRAGELESYLDGASRRITLASIKARVARQLAAAQPVDGSNRRESIHKAAARSVAARKAKGKRPGEAFKRRPSPTPTSPPTNVPETKRCGAPEDGENR
jgi:hypothetical protein